MSVASPLRLFETLVPFFSSGTEEIFVHGNETAWGIQTNSLVELPFPFASASDFAEALFHGALAAGTRLDPIEPSAGGTYANGAYRWHAVVPPLSKTGPTFCMRRHRLDRLSLGDFCLSDDDRNRLTRWVEEKLPIVVCGATGSGKTSFLASLMRESALEKRVVVLEEIDEIPLLSKRWAGLVARKPTVDGRAGISLAEAATECLRLRPDIFVVGELRRLEVRAWLDVVTAGFAGSVTTLHASSIDGARQRLANMVAQHAPQVRTGSIECGFVLLTRDPSPRVQGIGRTLLHDERNRYG